MNEKKLTGKDLINIGIYAAVMSCIYSAYAHTRKYFTNIITVRNNERKGE